MHVSILPLVAFIYGISIFSILSNPGQCILITWWQPVVKICIQMQENYKCNEHNGISRANVHQHTSYSLQADHPVTVGHPDYQAL